MPQIDDLEICRTCDGIGLHKIIYNHMVLQQNCTGKKRRRSTIMIKMLFSIKYNI